MDFARPQHLVETDWLAQHLEDPGIRVLECTVYLQPADVPGGYRVESGRAKWSEGHIPGAGFVDLQEELSDRTSKLRFMMPPAAQFAEALGRAGVGDGVRVILYDRNVTMWATRVWWMLRAFGFDDAAVLNGGFKKWTLEGRPVATDAGTRPARTFTPRPRPALMTDKAGVLGALGESGACVLNALSEEQHRGTGGATYGRPGRIAGSVNVAARELVDPKTHAYLPADVLRAKFQAAGALDARRVVTYCGGGIAASSDAFVLTLLGRDDVAIYDASLSEWAADPSLPMERG
ncbi:MAG TPA: sulfurtransferase [Candidatus Acidoferrum sp.]|jgi:thiosulfate/3-mercaptopyruvate sulfurtransferase|nr:sulfurtransferase [Candidatus Acidoferrum sp.]